MVKILDFVFDSQLSAVAVWDRHIFVEGLPVPADKFNSHFYKLVET